MAKQIIVPINEELQFVVAPEPQVVTLDPQPEVTTPLQDLQALFRKKHMGCRVAGKGGLLFEEIRIGDWTYGPTTLDDPRLHPQGVVRGHLILDKGIPVLGWMYGKEDKPKVKPEVQPIQPKRELDIDWDSIAKGVAIGLLVGTCIVFLPALLFVGMGVGMCLSGDPALYCVLSDEELTIVEIFRWFDN